MWLEVELPFNCPTDNCDKQHSRGDKIKVSSIGVVATHKCEMCGEEFYLTINENDRLQY